MWGNIWSGPVTGPYPYALWPRPCFLSNFMLKSLGSYANPSHYDMITFSCFMISRGCGISCILTSFNTHLFWKCFASFWPAVISFIESPITMRLVTRSSSNLILLNSYWKQVIFHSEGGYAEYFWASVRAEITLIFSSVKMNLYVSGSKLCAEYSTQLLWALVTNIEVEFSSSVFLSNFTISASS